MFLVGAILLPVGVFVCLRLLRFHRLTAFVAAAAVVFASARLPDGLALGLAFGVFFLGATYRSYSQDREVWVPALGLALAGLAWGGAAAWGVLSATYLLYIARKPWRTILFLAAVGSLALALYAAAGLARIELPDPSVGEIPWAPLLAMTAGAAVVAAVSFIAGRRTGGPDHRVLYLAHAILVALALAVARPVLARVSLPETGLRGALLVAAALAFGVTFHLMRRSREPATGAVDLEKLDCELVSPAPRWGGVVPVGLILVLLLSRLLLQAR